MIPGESKENTNLSPLALFMFQGVAALQVWIEIIHWAFKGVKDFCVWLLSGICKTLKWSFWGRWFAGCTGLVSLVSLSNQRVPNLGGVHHCKTPQVCSDGGGPVGCVWQEEASIKRNRGGHEFVFLHDHFDGGH